ncbi:MAG: DctP family TRAP transporter solute-binding subunit [Candidatus Bipolaricaulia bacterium]
MKSLTRRDFIKTVGTTAAVLSTAGFLSQAQGTVEIRMGHDGPPTQPYNVGLATAGRFMQQLSGGRIEMQVFPAGQLGNQQQQLLQTIDGTQEAWMGAAAWIAQFHEPLGVFNAAYAFRNVDHMVRFARSNLGRSLIEQGERAANLVVADTWYLGTRQVTVRDTGRCPPFSPDDFGAVKLRAPNAPAFINAARALGSNPTPLGFGEVYGALQSGVIDAQENPLPTIDAAKFYEVVKFLILTSHIVDNIMPFFNKAFWDGLSRRDRNIILEALEVGGEEQNQIIVDQEASLAEKFNEEDHLHIITPDKAPFRDSGQKIFSAIFGDLYADIQRFQ